MALARNAAGATKSIVAAGAHSIVSDTKAPAGGDLGFRPHQLLEAALASCIAITLRMVAEERGYALEEAVVDVEVDRSAEAETVFRTKIDLRGALSETERNMLMRTAARCPVRKTLSKQLRFVETPVG